MANIVYTYMRGTLVGIWPGKSVRKKGIGSRKTGQIYLGKVFDRDKGIFWTSERGYYTFNPTDQSFGEVAQEDVPPAFVEPNKRKGDAPVEVDFGDGYFLHHLINGTGYDRVLDTIECQNRDSLRAAVAYYVLESSAKRPPEFWCRQNYASFLYPRANLASQRFSALLAAIGRPLNIQRFLVAHRHYLGEIYGDDLCVLIDSNVNGEGTLKFRLVAIVQKSTGLPLLYECIPDNVVDGPTLTRLIAFLEEQGCHVDYSILDSCPSTMKTDFLSSLSPLSPLYKEAVQAHGDELEDPQNGVCYKDHLVHIVKISTIIAKDAETGEDTNACIFLCKDMSANTESDPLPSKASAKAAHSEDCEAAQRGSVFALVTNKDLSSEQVLSEYFFRQYAEQFFDYGKKYAKFLPARQQTMETLSGHLLLAFIASFLVRVVKNRLGLQNLRNPKQVKSGETSLKKPLFASVSESPTTLFRELRGQKADVFEKALVPMCPVKKAIEFYRAFGLASPSKIDRSEDDLSLRSNAQNTISKELVFKPCGHSEEIVATRETGNASCAAVSTKRGRGRPVGSKNKKTPCANNAESLIGTEPKTSDR
ncbi:MAG: hypothetical protein IJU76_13990 [Desulfovibrionaceae bacterium]|nr:hypothetical protein [Desulfovibrionaceae bacterium]